MAYLEPVYIVQPPRIESKRAYRVIGPRRCCSRIKIRSVKVKIECINNKTVQEHKMTHLGHMHIVQAPESPLKYLNGVIGLVIHRW